MIKNFFQLDDFNTSIRTEVIAGITSFLACSYIIVVNPGVLSATGIEYSALLTATVLISMFSSIAMGLYANNPIVLAPGMGLNAFFAFSLVIGMKVPVPTALGAVFWSGVIFILLSIFKLRELIIDSIPLSLQKAVACGIGLFIAFIGFKNAGMVIDSAPTLVTMGPINPITVSFFIGFAITCFFVLRKIQGGLLFGIIITTIIFIPIGRLYGDQILVSFKGIFAYPDFSLFGKLDFLGALKWSLYPAIFSLVFTDLFDTLSTFVGVSQAGGLIDENGRPIRMKKSLLVDAVATTCSGIVGISPTTSFIESAAGIQAGGRTGLTAVVAGLLFFPFLFLSPLLSMIPAQATAPALILVGAFMMAPVLKIKWDQLDEAIPAFLAMILIPLTFSISHGIIWGFLSYTLCKLIMGKHKEIPKFLYLIDALCLVMLFIH
ncbi:MAG: permease [Halobacteriovorax sp.]|nr:permease [Halobacteriovorax sp.]|tara:strand:- start:213742 stop:215043 length:1302 start_codon:yes stop_codon:yes gene_type:complete